MINQEALKSVLDQPEDLILPSAGECTNDDDVSFVYALRDLPDVPEMDDDFHWMRISFDDLTVRWYELLRVSGWNHEHRQHPDIAIG